MFLPTKDHLHSCTNWGSFPLLYRIKHIGEGGHPPRETDWHRPRPCEPSGPNPGSHGLSGDMEIVVDAQRRRRRTRPVAEDCWPAVVEQWGWEGANSLSLKSLVIHLTKITDELRQLLVLNPALQTLCFWQQRNQGEISRFDAFLQRFLTAANCSAFIAKQQWHF